MDLSKIYPRIKGVDTDTFPDPDIRSSGKAIILTQDESPVSKELTNGIAIFYAEDQGNSFRLINYGDISNTITIEMLHDAAMENLATAVSDKTEISGDAKGIMMLTNGGNFEATMILIDFIWEQLTNLVKDDICIAIPARDLLFFTAKNNPDGREKLREMVNFYFDERKTEGLITRHIYERVDDRWEYLETVE